MFGALTPMSNLPTIYALTICLEPVKVLTAQNLLVKRKCRLLKRFLKILTNLEKNLLVT